MSLPHPAPTEDVRGRAVIGSPTTEVLADRRDPPPDTRWGTGQVTANGTFAQRLNRLFSTVHPPTRGPYRSAEIVAALRAHRVDISAPYLSQLRTGTRTRPSPRTQEALAKIFGVRPEYFTNDHYYARIEQELLWCTLIEDPDLRRMVTDIATLTEPDQHRVRALIEHLRHHPTPP